MHSHLVELPLEDSKPTGQVQFKKWIFTCCMECVKLSHRPSAYSVIVSESSGENTFNLKVRSVQFPFTF